jgi:FKBP-type peptidyl-prolyl cis-trans isomerase 2
MADKVQKGDFVLVNYTGRVAASGRTFDTTVEDVARKEGIWREHLVFKPVLVVAGQGHLLPGLDEALAESEVGVPRTVKVPTAKGFGERKPELERVIAEREFLNRGLKPEVGVVVEIDGSPAKVTRVGGGRVRVDFNAELAGQDLEYDLEVKARFATPGEQVEALRAEFLPSAKASLADGTARVVTPGEVAKLEGYLRAKLRFLYFALRFVKGTKKVVFEEHYDAPGIAEGAGQANV